jgi:hypothetical protein
MAKTSVKAIPLEGFDSASLTASYQAINPTGLPAACFMLRISNRTKGDIEISYDGVTNHEYILSDETFELPVQLSAQPTAWEALISKGTIVYIKGTASVGTIRLTAYYV